MNIQADKLKLEQDILASEEEYVDLFNQTLTLLGKQIIEQGLIEDKYHIPSAYLIAKFKEAMHWNFSGLIEAKSTEELQVYQQGFQRLLAQLHDTLGLPQFTGNAKTIECLRFMTELAANTQAGHLQHHPELFVDHLYKVFKLMMKCDEDDHSLLNHYLLNLIDLLGTDNQEEFKRKQAQLIAELNQHPAFVDPSKAKVAQLLNLLEKQVGGYVATRQSYVEDLVDVRHYAKDFAWLALGGLLLTATLTFSILALPAVGVIVAGAAAIWAGIGLGGAVMLYSIIDFVREFSESSSEIDPRHEHHSQKKRLTRVLALVGVTTALGLGVAGLIAVIPALAISPLVPVLMAGFALAIATVFAVKLTSQLISAGKSFQLAEESCEQYNTKTLSEVSKLTEQVQLKETSTKIIEKELLGQVDKKTLEQLIEQLHEPSPKIDKPSTIPTVKVTEVLKPTPTPANDEDDSEEDGEDDSEGENPSSPGHH